jgi:BirA family biotin operon repressor/biotin-[acetyl-CoA-carboxylase] ligase
MNLLDAGRIRESIGSGAHPHLGSLEVFAEIDSTNSYLMTQAPPQPGRFRVALAENQTAGKGRMGRRWESPPLSGICLSLSYTFSRRRNGMSCLALAVGVGLAMLLEDIGVRGIGLKWPNDLIVHNAKLGGILTELRSATTERVTVVVGLGINVDLSQSPPDNTPINNYGPVIDLASCCDHLPSRNVLATKLIERLFDTVVDFDTHGFAGFHAAWPTYDWLRGQQVCAESAQGIETGLCEGIDSTGALMVRTDAGCRRVTSGSIRLDDQAGCKAS